MRPALLWALILTVAPTWILVSASTAQARDPQSQTSSGEDEPMVWVTTYDESGNRILVLRPADQSADGAEEAPPAAPTLSPRTPMGEPVTPPAAANTIPPESMIINDLEPEDFFPDRNRPGSGSVSTGSTVLNGPGNAATTTVASETHAMGTPAQSGGGADRWISSSGQTLPRMSAIGAYGGYPSTVGVQFAAPTDGPIAFRSGLTGMPGVGVLWTPGVELRFGQDWETYSSDAPYAFTNLYLGKEVRSGDDKEHSGLEAGLGYRWLLPDRRGVRWVAAIELGGRWSNDSALPATPSVRAFWMIAAP